MATERIKKIMPAGQGGDYTSLASWEAAEQADLTALDEIRIAEIDGYWNNNPDTTMVEVDGWITDSTRYIIIRAVGPARHIGKWDTTKYILKRDDAGYQQAGLDIREAYTKVYGLQLRIASNGYAPIVGVRTGDSFLNCVIDSVIVYKGSALHLDRCFDLGGFHANHIAVNCIAIGSVYGYYIGGGNWLQTQRYYNCVAYDCDYGYYCIDAGLRVLKNCLAQSCTDGYYGTFDTGTTNNCSDIASDAPGDTPRTGTVQFIDAANGDLRLSPYDTVAQLYGVNLYDDANYAVTIDIEGNSRGNNTANFDIGAHHPTTSIRTIKQSGGNYSSLAAWEAGEQRSLPSNNQIVIAEIDGEWTSADTTQTNIDGWTTDSARYIKIYTTPIARHKGIFETNKYRFAPSVDWAYSLEVIEQNVFITGLLIANTSSFGDGVLHLAAYTDGWSNQIIDSCIVYQCANGAGFYCRRGDCIIINSIAYNCITGFFITASFMLSAYFYNCIANNNSTYGFRCDDYRSMYAKNCYASNSGASDFSRGVSVGGSSENCYSEDGSDSTTIILPANVLFKDLTNNDYHLTKLSPLRGLGKSLNNDSINPFNHDIDGKLRIGPWDIGADQFEIVKVIQANKLYGINKLRIT